MKSSNTTFFICHWNLVLLLEYSYSGPDPGVASPQTNIKQRLLWQTESMSKKKENYYGGKKSIIEKFCLFYVFIMRSVCQIMIMARNISFIEL